MTPLEFAAIAAFICLATSVQGTMGFGFAILFTPLAAAVIDAQTAIACSILAGTLVSALQYVEQPGRAPIPSVAPFVAGSVAGIPFGLALLATADETLLRLLVGVAVLVSAVVVLARRGIVEMRRVERLPQMLGAGWMGGLTFGAVSMNGPPVLLYLHWLGRGAGEIRSRMFAFLATSGVCGVTLATIAGIIDTRVLLIVAGCLPAVGIGMLAGRWARPRLAEGLFVRLTLAVLAFSSIAAIAGAAERLLA